MYKRDKKLNVFMIKIEEENYMKTEKNILIAFILNFSFSIFEFIGGLFTNSVAIMSDAVHDIGDALSIGISYFLEKKSKKEPDEKYTYGYARYSVLGATITTAILLVGSVLVIINAINRILNPVKINYNGMIIFAIIGVIVNFIAAYFTKEGDSINQRSVNLHMIEDILGWIVVLIGAVIMRFTNILLLDSLMSILVAVFILFHSLKNLKSIIDLFLEKIPNNISIDEIMEHLSKINGIKDVHHIHVWSMDGYNNYATMHVVVSGINPKIKSEIREELEEHGIRHVTIELESENEECKDTKCQIKENHSDCEHHHHHH